ncbi:MAG: LysR substrate-binding domain-containing protein [Pseudomonadota bacterium]
MIALPTLRQLQFFLALVRRESFSKAADDCLVSQSTLSAAIKELENVLQAQLVDRTTKRFALTAAGEDVARRAAPILASVEDMARAAADRRPLEGPFHLGVIPTIAPFLLPKATPILRERFPDLSLFLREDLTENLVERLEAGQLDAALLAFPYDIPDTEILEIGDDPFFFAAPPGHPSLEADAITLSELRALPLLLLEDGHCLREHAMDACRLQDNRMAGYAATSLFTLAQMVVSGLGVTLLPKLAVDAGFAATAGIETRPLADPGPARRLGFVWRKGSGRSEEVTEFADIFKSLL